MCVCVHAHTRARAHTHTMEYYSAIKKNEIIPFAATQMVLQVTILNKGSQKEKDKDSMVSFICGI